MCDCQIYVVVCDDIYSSGLENMQYIQYTHFCIKFKYRNWTVDKKVLTLQPCDFQVEIYSFEIYIPAIADWKLQFRYKMCRHQTFCAQNVRMRPNLM